MDKQTHGGEQATPRMTGGESPVLPVRHPVVGEVAHLGKDAHYFLTRSGSQ